MGIWRKGWRGLSSCPERSDPLTAGLASLRRRVGGTLSRLDRLLRGLGDAGTEQCRADIRKYSRFGPTSTGPEEPTDEAGRRELHEHRSRSRVIEVCGGLFAFGTRHRRAPNAAGFRWGRARLGIRYAIRPYDQRVCNADFARYFDQFRWCCVGRLQPLARSYWNIDRVLSDQSLWDVEQHERLFALGA